MDVVESRRRRSPARLKTRPLKVKLDIPKESHKKEKKNKKKPKRPKKPKVKKPKVGGKGAGKSVGKAIAKGIGKGLGAIVKGVASIGRFG